MSNPTDPAASAVAGSWPRCGVSTAIFRGREVLLVERAKGALKGRWSLPGGHIEVGEPARSAALREVREETGVEAEIAGFVDMHEVVLRSSGQALVAHYLLSVFWGRWLAGEPLAASDAASARFVLIEAVDAYPLTDGAGGLIRRAWDLAQADSC
jgi:ADP-ribose pyrophosphatase YjhB (NUDIX family)